MRRRKRAAECSWCGAGLPKSRIDKRFCGDSCRTTASRARRTYTFVVDGVELTGRELEARGWTIRRKAPTGHPTARAGVEAVPPKGQ
jgi:hypothetical protein